MSRAAANTPIDFPGLVAINGGVVKHRGDVSVAATNLQFIVLHPAFPEHLLVARSGLFRLGEVIREVGADELLAREPRDLLGGLVDVGDFAVRRDGHQGIQAGFEQAAVVGAGLAQTSCLERPPRFRSSISVQVPNHLAMCPAASRRGTPRMRNQR